MSPLSWLAQFLVLLALIASSNQALYKKEDPILSLDRRSFFRVVFGSKYAWCVEFYQSSCGACRKFAPKYLTFARSVKGWESVVRVAAIDCAADTNVPVCEHFGIESVPNIRFFNAFSKNVTLKKANLGKEYSGEDEIVPLTQALVDLVKNQPRRPSRWPKMAPLLLEDAQSLTERQHKIMHAVVFEDKASYIGLEVILDMQACRNLVVHRVLKSDSAVVEHFEPSSFPSLLLFGHGQPHFISTKNNTREGYTAALLKLCGHRPASVIKPKPTTHIRPHTRRLPRTHIKPAVHMTDLVSTLVYIFRREIPMHSVLHGDQLYSLSKFLQVIHQCLPLPSHVAHHVNYILRQLKIYFGKGVTMQTWRRILAKRSDSSWIPDNVEWKACQGSSPGHRGYTCGLWTVFHTMTAHCLLATEGGAMAAGLHRYTGHNRRGDEAAALFEMSRRRPGSLDSRAVLLSTRSFIRHFFSCAECRKHFLAASVNISRQVSTSRHAVMWLWQVHNSVNHRVADDVSSDPFFPKVQFPLPSLCTDCRITTDDSEDPLLISWDMDRVFSFLLQFYGPSGIVWGEESSSDHHHDHLSLESHHQPHPLASAVFFMSFSLVALLAVYYWFKATYPYSKFRRCLSTMF